MTDVNIKTRRKKTRGRRGSGRGRGGRAWSGEALLTTGSSSLHNSLNSKFYISLPGLLGRSLHRRVSSRHIWELSTSSPSSEVTAHQPPGTAAGALPAPRVWTVEPWPRLEAPPGSNTRRRGEERGQVHRSVGGNKPIRKQNRTKKKKKKPPHFLSLSSDILMYFSLARLVEYYTPDVLES